MKHNDELKKILITLSAATLLGTGVVVSGAAAGLSRSVEAASVQQQNGAPADQKIQKQLHALETGLKEGMLLAYYVRDKVSNPQDTVSFSGKGFVFKDYKSFAAKFKALKGPATPQPGNLPKGFALATAIIYPPSVAKDSELYLQLEQELKAAAAGDPNKQLFSKIISWSQTNLSMQLYAKGKANFSIVTGVPPAKLPEGAVPFVRASETKKELTVNGRKVILTTDSAKEASFNTKLVWLDKSGAIQYTLLDNRVSKLTTNEMLAVAKSMIK